VPALPLDEIRGLRWARVSGAGLIKAASGTGEWDTAPNRPEMEGPAAVEGARAVMERSGGPGGDREKGEIILTVGSPFPRSEDVEATDPTEDAALVGSGYAALTALRGPRADDDAELLGLLDRGLAAAMSPLGVSTT